MKKRTRLPLSTVALVVLLTSVSFFFSQLGAYTDSADGSDDWSMYMHDPQRTGYSSSTAPDTNELKWFYNTTIEVHSSPVVGNGRVIVGLTDGIVLALNSTTGEKLWSYDTAVSYSIWGSPAIDSGRVYIGTDDHYEPYDRNNLYCLNESTGERLWQYSASNGITYSPLVSNGKVYFGAGYSVYCLNAAGGSFIWNFTTDREDVRWSNYINGALAILDDVLFVSSSDARLYAVNASTGVKIWRASADNPDIYGYAVSGDDTPVVYDGKIFYRSNTQVSCINAANGAFIWNTTESIADLSSPPAVANGKVFIGANLGGGGIYKFFCFNASTGSSIWTSAPIKSSIGPFLSSPAVGGGKVFFGTRNGKLYCLDENTGSEIWSYQGIDELFHVPAISGGTVFVSCGEIRGVSDPRAGGVYAFGGKYRTKLSLSLYSETSLLGFKVYLSGTLESEGVAIEGAPVVLSYSVTGGESWTDIATAQTSADGNYSVVWIPDATGTYTVKATWTPFPAHEKGEVLRMLSVKNFDEQNVFAVSSNSTLSELAFDSATRELRFTVTGETGTTGFVEVTVAKSLVAKVADLKVYLNGASLDYSAQSSDDSWVLYFTYAHSTHNVTVNLGATSSPIIWFIAVAVVAVVIGICLLIYFKKRKH